MKTLTLFREIAEKLLNTRDFMFETFYNFSKKILQSVFTLSLIFFISGRAMGENSSPEQEKLARFRKSARDRLLKKLTNKNGKPSAIIVLPPANYTGLKDIEAVNKTIFKAIQVYGKQIDVRPGEYKMTALNLEQFRKAVAASKADIVVETILNPTNFDIYLYDARTPFQIYAHTEPIAESVQARMSTAAAQYYVKSLVRRTLFRYIKNQYFEMPREQAPVVLKSEIPRYLASQASLEKVNREAHADWYAAVGLGAALSSGSTSKMWNSSLFSAQLGRRVYDSFYVEGDLDLFSYNIFGAFARYSFSNKEKSFKMNAGLGLAYAISTQTLNWDRNDDIKNGTAMVAPAFSVLLPISDVYLKAESKLYIGLTSKAVIFTITPGLLLMF